ncbi:MAG: hypothetical protein ACYSUQ_10595 [Planctomycetota bacterium]|jgi:acid stress-induced BolA-like protein IbaG/YrbA
MSANPRSVLDQIEGILRQHYPHDTVDVSLSGVRDNIHVIVVSRSLDNMTERQKQEHLWELLKGGGLDSEVLDRISMILPLSLEELTR